jgi:hypothetical protein
MSESRTREEYVELVKGLRQMLASDAEAVCSCPKTHCEWHGDCYNCVRIHRHQRTHLPNCMQPILREKIAGLARTVETTLQDEPQTPKSHWDYVNEVAPREGEAPKPPHRA